MTPTEVRAALRSGALDMADPETRRLVAKVLGLESRSTADGQFRLLRRTGPGSAIYEIDGETVEITARIVPKGPKS